LRPHSTTDAHATITQRSDQAVTRDGAVMTEQTCVRCGARTPPYDTVNAASSDGTYRLLCSRCFNEEMAQWADIIGFEHPQLTPVRLLDADGDSHEFHFRSLLLGDQISLEAFELAGNDESEGYRFQILDESQSDPFVLLGKLVQKIMRALSMKHLHEDASGPQVAGTMARGRIEWDGVEDSRLPCVIIDGRRVEWTDFGAMLMAFEGWQFRLELLDPSDEA
jgi:hypothetical protein